jgi:hypothetical protein
LTRIFESRLHRLACGHGLMKPIQEHFCGRPLPGRRESMAAVRVIPTQSIWQIDERAPALRHYPHLHGQPNPWPRPTADKGGPAFTEIRCEFFDRARAVAIRASPNRGYAKEQSTPIEQIDADSPRLRPPVLAEQETRRAEFGFEQPLQPNSCGRDSGQEDRHYGQFGCAHLLANCVRALGVGVERHGTKDWLAKTARGV